ncbi:hypothetical protein N656DRAFT_74908 [Canariomyces notabilis]|uniref:Uncharacterized protein n=1 Tax=Canariomyces notabilis TaxID=2074819 RepID=A0AAN6TE54_9PEZI|nr:hypothetical protein N656DRAFT_74908 [Canariomyces arenarius]
MHAGVKPLYRFADIAEFAHRHKTGTEAEFAADQLLVDQINKQEIKLQGWVVSHTRHTAKRDEYLILVNPGLDGERRLPQQGEQAKVRVVLKDDSLTRFWDACRIELPIDLGVTAPFLEKLAAFQVTVYIADAHKDVQPLLSKVNSPPTRTTSDSEENLRAQSPSETSSNSWDTSSCSTDNITHTTATTFESGNNHDVKLSDDNAVQVNFLLTASEATKNAEIAALDLLYGKHQNATERQLKAFEYFVLLRNPDFVVDMHHLIPHLKTVMDEPWWPGSLLAKKFAQLNPQQKAAYLHGFNNVPCGVCILPGCPGAGKTHLNLFTIVMAQLRPLPSPVRVKGGLERRCAKVLFIVDMNSPVDDVANRMVRLYDELGLKKSVIRMKGWGAEVKFSDRLSAVEEPGEVMHVDFSRQFLRTAKGMSLAKTTATRTCNAPSLDEAAWQRYDKYRDAHYESLTRYLEEELRESSDVLPLTFRRMVYSLYRDTLGDADFIATTPVAASNHFRGMFKPDLVYFDEAPHARELSNLIAIANFDPIAWIFCGDYRQTVPYVGSASAPANDNIYRKQMQVSMMERAAAVDAIRFELLMSHRSFGGLHQLASDLWYGGRMVSGNDGGKACPVPRLLLHVKNCGPEQLDGTSAWNPTHAVWVMDRVRELLNDTKFKHAARDEPGTILIISPYKKAYDEYRKAVKRLPEWAQKRVEARTVDVVQGHEADFVFVDLVKEKSTEFLDNPNRLCVAVTRARLGEIIMMHPKMSQSATFIRHSKHLKGIYSHCRDNRQLAWVDAKPGVGSVGSKRVSTSHTIKGKSPVSAVKGVSLPAGIMDFLFPQGYVGVDGNRVSDVGASTPQPGPNNGD